MLGVCKLHILAGVQAQNSAGAKFNAALVLRVDQHIRRQHFAKRAGVACHALLHKHGKHGTKHRRRDFGVRVAAQLFQGFQHRGQHGHTAPLSGPLPVHHMKYIPPPGGLGVGFNPRPVRPAAGVGVACQRVAVTYPVGYHHAVGVRFHALHKAMHIMALHRAGHQPVKAVRAANPVSLHQPHPQAVRLPGLLLGGQQHNGVTIHGITQKS